MEIADLLARARSALRGGCTYKLGHGGTDGGTKWPWDSERLCDCSGFVCWSLGIGRQTADPWYQKFNGGWINTDAMWTEAAQPYGMFRTLQVPQPGAVLVYPRPAKGSAGHCGIVCGVELSKVTSVIHCSSGNYKADGDAIDENAGQVLIDNPLTRVIWFAGLLSVDELVAARAAARFG